MESPKLMRLKKKYLDIYKMKNILKYLVDN